MHENTQVPPFTEQLICPDESLLQKYIQLYREKHPDLSSSLSKEDILNASGVYHEGHPTVAGTLVFSLAPQLSFPEYSIICLVVPGRKIGDKSVSGARFLENRRINGPLMTMLEESVDFVLRNCRMQTRITERGVRDDIPEYPVAAVKEAILNALLHRDYGPCTRESYIQIAMYYDRIEITSPGELHNSQSIEQLGSRQIKTRNSSLVRILKNLGITEQRYSGIFKMYDECRKYRFPDPEFISRNGEFTVLFRSGSMRPSITETGQTLLTAEKLPLLFDPNAPIEARILSFCEIPRSRNEISVFLGMKWDRLSRKYIHTLLQNGKLSLTLPANPRSPKQQYFSVLKNKE